MSIKDIIEGHINEALNKNKSLSEERLEICKKCPIIKYTTLGPICDPDKWINKNGEVSLEKQPGFIKGCACRLNAKTRITTNHCVINKW